MALTIREKIKALLAKAEASEHAGEAELFFTKATELMEEHQVQLFELHTEDPIGRTEGVHGQAGPPAYKSQHQVCLAAYYGASTVLRGSAKTWVVEIVGPEGARMITDLMTDYVWAQVCKAGGEIAKQDQFNRGQAVRHVAKALAVRVSREVRLRREAVNATPAREGTSFSLAVVDATKAYMQANYPGIRVTAGKKVKRLQECAVSAAKGISLNHQVSTGRNRLRLQ